MCVFICAYKFLQKQIQSRDIETQLLQVTDTQISYKPIAS